MIFITQNVINKKKSFTLIELLVVIILITGIYAIFLPNFTTYKINTEKITLKNIKKYLKNNFVFENNIKLTCLEKECYIFVDSERIKEIKIENLFSNIPNVYENDEKKEFKDIRINNFSKKVIFEIIFDYDYKSNDLLLEFDEIIYYYGPIKTETLLFTDMNEYRDYKENLKDEVKNAF